MHIFFDFSFFLLQINMKNAMSQSVLSQVSGETTLGRSCSLTLSYNPDFNRPRIKKAFEIVVGKVEYANQHCLQILTMFCTFPNKFQSLSKIYFVVCNCFQFNPFPNKPWLLCVCSTSLLKTLWEKGKLLVTSNFSFSHHDFYPFGKLSAIFIRFKIVVYRLFKFGRVKN